MTGRRSWVLSVTARHWVITWNDGSIQQLLRRVTRLETGSGTHLVVLNGVELDWTQETSLGATSRADFFSKARALERRVGRPGQWLQLPQLGREHRMLARITTSASSTVYKPVTVGGTALVWLSTPQTVYLETFDANDVAAGAGLRTATVTGLDADFNEVTETLTTIAAGTGAGPNSTNSFLRINSAATASTGTDFGGNYNSVYVRDALGTRHLWIGSEYTTALGANYGVGTGKGAAFTVPAGYTGYVTRIGGTSNSGSAALSWFLWSHSNDTASAPAKVLWQQNGDYPPYSHKDLTVPIKVPAKTDLWVTAICGTTGLDFTMTVFLVAD